MPCGTCFPEVQGALGLLFEGLLGLGGWLVQGPPGLPQAAGAHLYILLFTASHTCKQCQQYRQVAFAIICIKLLTLYAAQAYRQSHHDCYVTAENSSVIVFESTALCST